VRPALVGDLKSPPKVSDRPIVFGTAVLQSFDAAARGGYHRAPRMDVTCERCGTEYEFDETLVAARGTTVKCTNCGHLFKVFRPGASAAGGAESKSWTVRRASGGASESIASLKELQRLITVGQLTPDDQISRSGEGWKRLGDIAELQTFFAAAAAARESQRPARRDPTGGRVTDGRAYAPTGEVARGTDRPPPQSAPLPRATSPVGA